MEDTGADFTMTFRQLSEVSLSQLQTGSIPLVYFHYIHTYSSCNIHKHYFSPLTVTVSLNSQCGLCQTSHRMSISETGFSCIYSVCQGSIAVISTHTLESIEMNIT
ncbi:Protein adenylyltransferase SelO-1, mitochondrial [Labeo rohita]|uniref:Protein adenylyltransferase SelO-1, mitochondrial n=1 Tax=Labeo rohita TaxID=84645 RepID=A0ABQ8LGA6_LABRO|nr:Protein adenylyltransferase SelO-1, mitochondrial [Labeo rohita]